MTILDGDRLERVDNLQNNIIILKWILFLAHYEWVGSPKSSQFTLWQLFFSRTFPPLQNVPKQHRIS